MFKPHNYCRACGYVFPGAQGIKSDVQEKLIPVFDLGLQPLANDFAGPEEPRAGFAPLKVLFCPRCNLAQLSVVVDPFVLYSYYFYVTSPSMTMLNHFNHLTDSLSEEQPFSSALEVGSNDGTFLKYLQIKDVTVAGIDPAENLARNAIQKGVPTVTGTLSRRTAEEALRVVPKGFDLILARHVFCHVDDWREFIDSLAIASHRETLVAIEVPYVLDLLSRGEFDTIYHEHLSYLSLQSVMAVLQDSAWKLTKVLRFPVHGGAIVLLLRRKDFEARPDPGLDTLVEAERKAISVDSWKEFASRAYTNMTALKSFVLDARQHGKRVVGMGASAKSTVWVNACGFNRQDIGFITDTTTQKLWKLSPGSDIPIVDEGAILRELPDYVVCFCWNYRQEVLAKNQAARSKGVKFVFPVPDLEVVGGEESCCQEPKTVALSASSL